MSDSTIKAQIRAVVFGIFGLIVAVVLIRIVLKLVGANPDASLVRFWYDFTNFFVGLFRNTYPLLQDSLLKINIEKSAGALQVDHLPFRSGQKNKAWFSGFPEIIIY